MTVTVWSFVIRRVTYCTIHKKIRQNSDKNNTTLRKSTRFIKLHLSEVDFLAPGVKLRLRGVGGYGWNYFAGRRGKVLQN